MTRKKNLTDRQINQVINELFDMFLISKKSSWRGFNITLARFYRDLLVTLPDRYYEHIHDAFMIYE